MKHIRILSVVASALLAAACKNDDTDLYAYISSLEARQQQADTIAMKTIATDFSDLDETETIPTDEADTWYNDYVENATFDYTVYISYHGTSAVLSGDADQVAAIVSGAHVTVTSTQKNVTYVLSGSSTDGSFKIYSDHKFQLRLAGVSLVNPEGAAVNSQCGKTMYLVLADSTANSLSDGTSYAMTPGEDMKGALFSEGQIIFSGRGTLSVSGSYRNAIASDDYIRFRAGSKVYAQCSASHGVKANDGIFIGGGVLNIEVSGDAAKGLNSEQDIVVSGGRTTVITTGATRVEAADTSSCAAVKCDSTFTLSGGTLNLLSSGEGGKGINVNGSVAILGGELNIVTTGSKVNASPKGIKCDGSIAISGGYTYIYTVEGKQLDAGTTLTIADGYSDYRTSSHAVVVSY